MAATIAILAPSSVPFQSGGAEKLWWGLRRALEACPGICTELIKLPARENTFAELVDSYRQFSQLDLSHFDMLITTKYPAWIAAHPNHVCYMQHTLRGLYDTYHFLGLPERLGAVPPALADLLSLVRKPDPSRADLEPFFELCAAALNRKSLPASLFAFPGPLIREVVHFLDKIAFSGIRTWLAISGTVAQRKDYLPPDANCKILPHPPDLEQFGCGEGRYFFTASRLNGSKRLGLLIDAMRLVPGDIPLRIAGTGPDLEALKMRAAPDSRIEFLGRVTDEELSELYAGAIAVPFVPFDEDYGLITIEAMKSGKPVITTTDSGGVCEMVRNGETGIIVEPVASALAAAMTRLMRNRTMAAELGRKARESVAHITWPNTAQGILEHAACRKPRKKILVAAPFAPRSDGAGGERRFWHFCAELGREYSVDVVCMGSKVLSETATQEILPHVRQIAIPWPESALAEAERLVAADGISGDDIALMRHGHDSAALMAALQEAGAAAACVVLSHPWLYDAVARALPGLPIVYDAYNVEADLKRSFYGSGAAAIETANLEQRLCADAKAVFACSPEDGQRFAELKTPPERIHILPPGCEPACGLSDKTALRGRLAYPEATLALFVGSGHKPNMEAARAIMDMAPQVPEVEFLLAGTVTTQAEIRSLAAPANVHLLGEITEKTKDVLLSAADLALNPVTSGSGVNLKTIEYLANGLPFISTPFGMRGVPGDYAPAATVCPLAEFPQKLRQLAKEPPDRDAVAKISERFRQNWSWPQVLKPLRPALAGLLERIDAPAD